MLLRIEGIDFKYESTQILDRVTFEAKSGEFLGVMGPNGSGKTTLLKCLTRVLKPHRGTVLIDRQDITLLSRKEIAQTMGVVPQSSEINFAFTVFDIVLMGRTPHITGFKLESEKDYEITRKALELTHTSHLSERTFDQLSGGEKQRVIIARALAQEPRILLLDEPTIHLDIGCQVEVLNLVRTLCKQREMVLIAVLHDLNQASQFCDRLILLNDGKIVSVGTPEIILTSENIRKTYNVDVLLSRNPVTNALYVTPFTLPQNPREGIIHIVCGGGSGSQLMNILSQTFTVTAGVLNVLDSDFGTARSLNITVAGEIPFSQITEESSKINAGLAEKADIVVLTDFPVGFGNLKNVEVVETALKKNISVIVIDSTPVEEKDFTDGELKEFFARLRENRAVFVNNIYEAVEEIEKIEKIQKTKERGNQYEG